MSSLIPPFASPQRRRNRVLSARIVAKRNVVSEPREGKKEFCHQRSLFYKELRQNNELADSTLCEPSKTKQQGSLGSHRC